MAPRASSFLARFESCDWCLSASDSLSEFDEDFSFDGQINFGARAEADHAEAFPSFHRISDLFPRADSPGDGPCDLAHDHRLLLSLDCPGAPRVHISAGRITRIKESAAGCFGVGNFTRDRRAIHVDVEHREKNGDALDFGFDQMIFAGLFNFYDHSIGRRHREVLVRGGLTLGISEEIERKQEKIGKENCSGRQQGEGNDAADCEAPKDPTSFAQSTQLHCLIIIGEFGRGEPIVEIKPQPDTLGVMTSTVDMTMGELLEAFPGAQRALFRNYHIGGCASCGFRPDETLAQVCTRNDGLDPEEVLERIRRASAEDERMMISPLEVKQSLDANGVELLDIRTREEYETVHIEGAQFLDHTLMQQILASKPKERLLVFVDHKGSRSLDAAAYFAGHGFTNIKCMRGGIDAWSVQVNPNLPRYTLE